MDLTARLRDHAIGDHQRGCQGRCYSCECGYDGKTEPLLTEAAAEIERMQAALAPLEAAMADDWAYVLSLPGDGGRGKFWREILRGLRTAVEQ